MSVSTYFPPKRTLMLSGNLGPPPKPPPSQAGPVLRLSAPCAVAKICVPSRHKVGRRKFKHVTGGAMAVHLCSNAQGSCRNAVRWCVCACVCVCLSGNGARPSRQQLLLQQRQRSSDLIPPMLSSALFRTFGLYRLHGYRDRAWTKLDRLPSKVSFSLRST